MVSLTPTISNTDKDSRDIINKFPLSRFFIAYVGISMYPTLLEPEVLEINPYEEMPGVGDVVFFLPPDASHPVVHRIVRIAHAGISTRGDNNSFDDPYILQSASINGRVVAAWRGSRKRRKISGGVCGRLTSHWLKLRRCLDRGLSPLFHPLYQTISRGKILEQMMPEALRPKVVVFNVCNREHFQLLLGKHIIGQYDEHKHQWLIRRPFKLFVDVMTLPVKDKEVRFD